VRLMSFAQISCLEKIHYFAEIKIHVKSQLRLHNYFLNILAYRAYTNLLSVYDCL